MKFSEYFSSWLYEGYYSEAVKIGKEGDFYTSLSVGSFFGLTLAKHFLSKLDFFPKDERISIVEIGANEAYFLMDFIQGIFTFQPELLKNLNFVIIEPQQKLRILQKHNFAKNFGEEIQLKHYESLKDFKTKNAFFVANELFDSFPCEVVDGDNMLYIENGQRIFKESDEVTKILAKKQKVQKGEVILKLNTFVQELAASAEKAIFLTFDYGFYEQANNFSLRIFKKHQVYDFFEVENLEDFYKKSDITYNVNFKALEESFLEQGFKIMMNYKKQNEALIEFGILDILEFIKEKGGEQAYENALRQVKYLILPAFLGEKFKAIEFYK